MNNTSRAPKVKIRRWLMCLFCTCLTTLLNAQNHIEYFWNTDPGIGRGNILVGNNGVFNSEISTEHLPIGLNILGIRALDGKYASSTLLQTVFNALPIEDNTKLEYFWDNDPGIGHATQYPITLSGSTTVFDMSLVTSTMPAGIHTLGIRLGYGNIWTQTMYSLVAIPPQNGKITQIEYFWDNDPGLGQATQYPVVSDGETALVNMSILTDTISGGMHLLGLRVGNGLSWSQTYTQIVGIAPNGGAIDAVEYFWDNDPGYGKATPLNFEEGDIAIVKEDIPVPEDYGSHVLVIRAKAGDIWSSPLVQNICKNANPDFSLPKDTVCVGEEVVITNLTTEATEQTQYMWDMDGDGEIDITGEENLTYAYDEPGEYMIMLSVKTVGDCETTCSKPIVVLGTSSPSVSISALSKEGCEGDTICFVAKATDAGLKPEFEWLVNDQTIANENTDTLKTNTLTDGSKVQVRVYSSNPCSQIDVAESAVLTIKINALPEVSIEPYFPVYTTESAFMLNGGVPTGGIYYIDGEESTHFDPQEHAPGIYTISYIYEAPTGCRNVATQRIELREPNENSLLRGDVNKDEKVDILDILCTVDLIYGRTFPTWNKTVADLNGDEIIDISDILGIAAIILGKENISTPSLSSHIENYITVNNTTASFGNNIVDLTFELNGENLISGMQFDISLPDGVELKSDTEGLIVGKKANTDGNVYTLIAYSNEMKCINGQYKVKATLPINLSEGIYDLIPEHSVLARADMSKLNHRIYGGKLTVGSPTNILSQSEEKITMHVGQDGLYVKHADGGTLMITDMSGRFILATEINSDICFIPFDSATGTYIAEICVGEKSVRLKFIWK